MGWVVYQRFGETTAHAAEGTTAESEESSSEPSSESAGEKKGKSKNSEEKSVPAPPKLAVPLVPTKVTFFPKLKGKDLTSDMIISTNSKTSQRIITRLSDVKSQHFAMVQVFLSAKNTDELIRKVNANQPELYNSITNRIGQKSYKNAQSPSFRNVIRAEMLYECNRILGSNVVQEVIITELVVQ